jgi:hypothetical protein
VSDRWDELVTVALLGTDRRDPSPPPPGPVADVVADVRNARTSLDTAGAVLVEVATLTAARRAGLVPGPVVAPPLPPPADPRPEVPARARLVLERVLAEWPVLEDEWTVTALVGGWRIPGDVVVELLHRHRRDPLRRARVEALAGPLAAWLAEQLPSLAPPSRQGTQALTPEALLERAVLPVPADLSPTGGSASSAVEAVVEGFQRARFGPSHRAVLVNLVASIDPGPLTRLAAELAELSAELPGAPMAHWLADLARTRAELHAAFGPPDPEEGTAP